MKLLATSAAVLMGASILATSSPVFANTATTKNGKTNSSESHQIAAAETAPVSEKAPEPKMVTVAPGDYLEKLATANNSTSARMFDANPDVPSPDLIFPDQKLRVPTETETLSHRELPVAPAAVVDEAPAAPQPAYVAPARPAAPAANYAVGDGSVWDRLAQCESGGNWAINTGNGFYGGIQFTLSSWASVGGSGMPNQASREEQIARGQMLQARQGWGAWPACTAKLGIR